MGIDISLLGKPVEQLTPAELAALQSQVAAITESLTARQKTIKDEGQKIAFGRIADLAKTEMTNIAWQKLPRLELKPNTDGTAYEIDYVATKRKGAGKGTGGGRAPSEVNGGKVTVNKIAVAFGGIAKFVAEGKEYEGIKEVVGVLKQPDGKPESERCYELSRKGVSASDILIKSHPEDVTLVFNDGTKLTVKDAAAKLTEARKATEAPATPEEVVPV